MTLRVNIVVGSADLNWIGGRFARELVARLPDYDIHADINSHEHADLDYHQIVYGTPERTPNRPVVGLFTHGSFRPLTYAKDYDGHLATNPVMADYLITGGATDPCIIAPVVDDCFIRTKPLVFGVAGRTYSDGRKGEHLVAAMVERGYTFVAWGSGWPCPIVGSSLDELPDFYRSIDYYIDTSSDEGGCIPAVEAAAMGIPVISHTVGVERAVIPYSRANAASLEWVLHSLTHPRTYDDFAREHAQYFYRVLALPGTP